MAAAIGGDAFDRRQAVVWREVDDGETRAGLQRAQKIFVEGFGRGDVVIDAAQENRVATVGGELRVVGCAFDDRDIGEFLLGNFVAKRGQLGGVNFCGVDVA